MKSKDEPRNKEILGHSLRGLCGLKYVWSEPFQCGDNRHSLRGLCGLKSVPFPRFTRICPSQSARTVWIEIPNRSWGNVRKHRHSLRGLCGLKFHNGDEPYTRSRHSLRGLCGLKSEYRYNPIPSALVTVCEDCVD